MSSTKETNNEPTTIVLQDINATFLIKDVLRPRPGSKVRVYRGYLNGTTPIALKRYEDTDEEMKKEAVKDLQFFSALGKRHENIIRYFGNSAKDQFTYLATELCDCSVADIFDEERKQKTRTRMQKKFIAISKNLSLKEVLLQATKGVEFIHKHNRIHRNLHPDNFLISSVDENNGTFIIKLTDFQHSKELVEPSVNTCAGEGMGGWAAPESYSKKSEFNPPQKTDISSLKRLDSFLLGLFYFYVLSKGKHPFGEKEDDQMFNIKNKDYKVYTDEWDGSPNLPDPKEAETTALMKLVKGLLKWDAQKRIDVQHLLSNKYFITKSNKIEEFYDIYNDPVKTKPGLCIIITQAKYHNSDADLGWGSDGGVLHDAITLETTFTGFGYDVLHFRNLRAQQIGIVLSPQYLIDLQEEKSLSHFASLVVCIIGHGDKGVVQGVDGEVVSLNALELALNNGSCPHLEGKPKVFIIDACQGQNDQAVDANQVNTPPIPLVIGVVPAANEKSSPIKDFLRLSATIEEFVSWGDAKGSEFTRVLCKALTDEYANKHYPAENKKRNLLQVFTTDVVPKVCEWSPSEKTVKVGDKIITYTMKQTPEYRTCLRKNIRFQPFSNDDKTVCKKLIYDGEKNDKSFEPGRMLWPLTTLYFRELGQNWKDDREYQFLLKTVYAVAGKELPVVQRAVAWVIINRAKNNLDANRKEWGGPTIEGVCKTFECWGKPITLRDRDDWTNWNAIDQWLPNVKEELNEWDPSRGSLDFLEHPTEIVDASRAIKEYEVKFGKFKFYKIPYSSMQHCQCKI